LGLFHRIGRGNMRAFISKKIVISIAIFWSFFSYLGVAIFIIIVTDLFKIVPDGDQVAITPGGFFGVLFGFCFMSLLMGFFVLVVVWVIFDYFRMMDRYIARYGRSGELFDKD
jgi:hypothetical protein